MLNQVVNAVEPVVVSAAVAVLTAIIGFVGNAVVKFINTKKTALVAKIGADKYNYELTVARECFGEVDEDFRINPELTKTAETAAVKFADEIRKKIPALTDDEVEHLRQAVAGEVNRGRKAVDRPALQSTAKEDSTTPTQQTMTFNIMSPTSTNPTEVAQKIKEAVN